MVNRSSVLRQVVAAILLVVTTLSGFDRALASGDPAHHRVATVAGIQIQICHPGDRSAPDRQGRHDCCDACALCAPVSLPDGGAAIGPVRIERSVDTGDAPGTAPPLARIPTPRMSRGPPGRVT